ncbi:MAG: hypothetical protein V4466_05070 [Pseudomonadota bacterium]
MRMIAILTAAALLSGCATTGSGRPDRVSQYDKLNKACVDRGGLLMPIPGAMNANVAANYSCDFRGQMPGPAK